MMSRLYACGLLVEEDAITHVEEKPGKWRLQFFIGDRALDQRHTLFEADSKEDLQNKIIRAFTGLTGE